MRLKSYVPSDVLRKRRETAGISLERLAELAKIDTDRIRAFECGDVKLSPEELKRVRYYITEELEEAEFDRRVSEEKQFLSDAATCARPLKDLIEQGERCFQSGVLFGNTFPLVMAQIHRQAKNYQRAAYFVDRIMLEMLEFDFSYEGDEVHVSILSQLYESASIALETGCYRFAATKFEIIEERLSSPRRSRYSPKRNEFDVEMTAKAQVMLAVALINIGEHSRAIQQIAKSNRFLRRSNVKNRGWYEARNSYTFGEAMLCQERYGGAAEWFRTANAQFSKLCDHDNARKMNHNAADALRLAQDYESAFRLAKEVYEEEVLCEYVSNADRAKTALLLAEIEWARGNWFEATNWMGPVLYCDGVEVTTQARGMRIIAWTIRDIDKNPEYYAEKLADAFNLLRNAPEQTPNIEKLKNELAAEFIDYATRQIG